MSKSGLNFLHPVCADSTKLWKFSYSLISVDHPPFDEWVIKKVNYYDVDLLTGPCQSSTLLRQLHPPFGGCQTGQEQSLQYQGVCYWHIATLPRTACFGRYAILRKQEIRLCWVVTAPYIWSWITRMDIPIKTCLNFFCWKYTETSFFFGKTDWSLNSGPQWAGTARDIKKNYVHFWKGD